MKYRVMLVDDTVAVLETLLSVLDGSEFEAEGFQSAAEALARLEEVTFDAIVTDMIMPDMDGSEFIQRIRTKDPDARVVALSGGDHRIPPALPLLAGEALGADAVFQKPLRRDQLLKVLYSLVR